MEQKYALLNQGEDNEMDVTGYRTERWRQILCIIGYIFSLGFLPLLFYWKPEISVWCKCTPCSLDKADVILFRTTDEYKQYFKKKVSVIYPSLQGAKPDQVIADQNSIISKCLMKSKGKIRCVKVQKIHCVWDASESQFRKIGILDEGLSCSDIHTKYGSGLSNEEQSLRKQMCGLNKIEVKIIPIWKLLFKEIFNPFYVFQAYSLSIWIATNYLEYSMAILLMTAMSIIATVYNLRVQSIKLHKMAESYNSIMVTMLQKNGEIKEVESQSLVPGDVIVLSENKLFLPCDAILISGGCTVNEGMLTGESIPVTKTPLPNIDNSVPWKIHCGDDYKKHVLFCGTQLIQTKPHGKDLVKAVVLQTGFNTAKGDLVRAILYNKPISVKLHKQALRFLVVLVFIALAAATYTAVVYSINGASVHDTVLMTLLMITAAVNAALPAALTLGLLYAQTRLKKKGIFCISPQRINMAGQLNLVCFDKTGTLTEDALDLYGLLPCEGSCFQKMHQFSSGNTLHWGHLLGAMASCHSLIILEGKIHGDPLELKMFEGTNWELEGYIPCSQKDGTSASCTMVKPGLKANKVPVEGISILHQFPFSSTVQRMSVITQAIGLPGLTLYLKGAPEAVVRYCKPETVPHDFSERLDFYTTQGFRVIGLAYRSIDIDFQELEHLQREDMECDLTFLGFLIMENRLKPETSAVLQELTTANIRTVMVTGDNLQTALTVGKNCGIIPTDGQIILIEATESTEGVPPSITWRPLCEMQASRVQTKKIHIDRRGDQLFYPTTCGNFHFAMNGKSYQVIVQHFYDLLPKILLNGTIFARMTPRQKSNLIEELQKIDFYVGMCGDGANDCGALKVAHAGISLSELEASVASPFTSKIPNIECVPMLIKEGRNALVTSFAMFKFMTMFILIGLFCIVLLFWRQKLLGNYQYLMQDLAINITFALTLGLNGPAPKLAPYRPSGHLLSPPLLLSVFLHFIFTAMAQTTIFVLLLQQPWYSETDVFSACLPLNHTTANVTTREPRFAENFLTATMFPVTGFNLITIGFVFSKGKPFRQPLYTNYWLLLLVIFQVASYLFLLFADFEVVYYAMELVCTPYAWRVHIFITMLVHFVVSYAVEEGFIENRMLWLKIKKIFNYKSKSQYRKLQRMLENCPNWPPLNKTDYATKSVSTMNGRFMICNETVHQIPMVDIKEQITEQIYL
ncbi:probable cation-transporting ATPase 13A5 [Spea bombifrons]|uniref:probable cation-transporting ATPase 13A5 n=1 Tax=Spea bombifrons TaxID=233779 RepID=UPI00234B4663|nr:probable cation-transporting ATPase 13A5 [Spea bombifrons]